MSYIRDLQNHRNPNLASLCTNSHTGTSASAPIAAALAALALEAKYVEYEIIISYQYF